jgi:hypothetical protein
MVVNKNTSYAHWHKTEGRGYSLGNAEKDKAITYVAKWKEGLQFKSGCCGADFDAFGHEKEEGIWQEKCLKCGKLCEPILTPKTWHKQKYSLNWLFTKFNISI